MKRFWAFFWTQFLGALNDNIFKSALLVWLTYSALSLSPGMTEKIVALSGGIFILPFFLFSGLAGEAATRLSKNQVIRWVKIAEVGIVTLGMLGFLLQALPLLLLTLFLMGTHSTFFGPIKYSILPALVPPEKLGKANAWVEAGTFLAVLLGTTLGSALVGQSSGLLWTYAGMLSAALMGWVFCTRIPAVPVESTSTLFHWNILVHTLELLKLSVQNRRRIVLLQAISWFWAIGVTITTLLPLIGKNLLQVSEGVVSSFLAVFSIGIGIGSFLGGRATDRMGPKNAATLGAAVLLLALFQAWAFLPTHPLGNEVQAFAAFFYSFKGWRIWEIFAFLAIGAGMYIVPLYTAMQVISPSGDLSRIVAANNIWNAIWMVGASVLLAAILGHFSIPSLFFGLAVLHLLLNAEFFYLLRNSEETL